jgi:hypothetical protein
MTTSQRARTGCVDFVLTSLGVALTLLIAPAVATAAYKCPDGSGGTILQGHPCPERVSPETRKAREDANKEVDKIQDRINERARIRAERRAERDRARDLLPEEIDGINRSVRDALAAQAQAAKIHQGEVDAASRVCVAIRKSGASTCDVDGGNKTLRLSIHASEGEAQKICDGIVSEIATVTNAFKGAAWRIRIFSPFRETPPTAACTLR